MAKTVKTKPVLHRFRINTDLIGRTLHFSIGEDKCTLKSGEYVWELIRAVAAGRLGAALKRKVYKTEPFDVIPVGPQLQAVKPKVKPKPTKSAPETEEEWWQKL